MKAICSFFCFLLGMFCSCAQSNEGNSKRTSVGTISVKELKSKLNPNSTLLDVRTPQEVNQGVIKGAVHINVFAPNFSARADSLPKDKPVYVYCKSGGRSSRAARQLTKLGFEEVYNVSGGITAWQANNYPVTKLK